MRESGRRCAPEIDDGVRYRRVAAHWLDGCDPTPGIVSVDADAQGRGRVWRRLAAGRVELTEHRFPNWFLSTSLDLLAHLPLDFMRPEDFRAAHGQLQAPDGLTVVELDDPAGQADDAYRYLVLVPSQADIEMDIVDTANKSEGADARSLTDLRGLVLVRSPIEQFLILSGKTYFKGMQFEDLRRLQFDLETTGLDPERDRIFMIGMRDSTGWTASFDLGTLTETELLQHFIQAVNLRDPDVVENHNIFAFDLPFLVRRAARLGIRLTLGRDGSEPIQETDFFDSGERAEPFLRWRLVGREVIDTQHAVRRYGLSAPDMRRHGLKDAARYFGFARTDREYVPGIEIWPTFQIDPERVRRYVLDDVDEVDGLSRRLLQSTFTLAQRLPRPYERIAADVGACSLWEPLLVRGYLHEGCAIPAPTPRLQPGVDDGVAELRIQGVLGPAVRATADPLLPCTIAGEHLHAANDTLELLPKIVQALLDAGDVAALVDASHAYLAGEWLFSDPESAAYASQLARAAMDTLVGELERLGCRTIELDGERLLFSTPDGWCPEDALPLTTSAARALPEGVRLRIDGQYRAVYARAARSTMLLEDDGGVTLMGGAYRPARLERYGERFLREAAARLLVGDVAGMRRLFGDTVLALRTAQVPLEDLCVLVTLHKSPNDYRRSATREEPYEVLLAAGVRSWRVGQRIRYFRTHAGELRLLTETDAPPLTAADAEYYVQRLVSVYCHQFAQAFRPDDFRRIFSMPVETEVDLSMIRSVAQPV